MNVVKVDKRLLGPILAGFFIMSFSDIVAPITGRIATEFPAEHQGAVSFLPTMVFLWFLLLSIPVATMMSRIGRKAISLLGYGFVATGLMVPYLAGEGCDLVWYFVGFGLLGIGSVFVQVSVNPLLASIVPPERMTSYFAIGQISRNLALLLLAPIVMALIAFTGSWRLLLPLYAGIVVLGGLWLQLTSVPEPKSVGHPARFAETFALLRNRTVLICALGVAAFLATDVGIGFMSVRLIDHSSSILTITGFYACRIVGALVGAWVLLRVGDVKFMIVNMSVALGLCVLLLFVRSEVAIYAVIGVLGFALSCVFSIFFAMATKAVPDKANAISGLMILAISAGALSGPICGAIIRSTGYASSGMIFVIVCVSYMLWASFKLKNIK